MLQDLYSRLSASESEFCGVHEIGGIVHDMISTAKDKPNRTDRFRIPPFEEWEKSDQDRFWEVAGHMMRILKYDTGCHKTQGSGDVGWLTMTPPRRCKELDATHGTRATASLAK